MTSTSAKHNLASPTRKPTHNMSLIIDSTDPGTLKSIERQKADLVLSNTSLRHEFEELETSFKHQEDMISSQDYKIKDYEATLKQMNSNLSHNKVLFEKELDYYQNLISNLQLKVNHLSNELLTKGEENFELRDNYERMMKDFKILQANYELEQNSKSVLLEQVENLSLKVNQWNLHSHGCETNRYSLQNQQSSNTSENQIIEEEQESSHSVIRLSMIHTLTDDEEGDFQGEEDVEIQNVDFEDDEEEDEIDDDDDDLSNLLSYLDQELKLNSSRVPIRNTSHQSIEVSENFKFPLSSSHNYNANRCSFAFTLTPFRNSLIQGLQQQENINNNVTNKRNSVPAFCANNRLSMETVPDTDDDDTDGSSSSSKFILSPFKLHSQMFELTAGGAGASGIAVSGSDNHGNSDFKKLSTNKATASTGTTTRRFSRSFPRHARYNSHDIIPIKVEFEQESIQESPDHRIMSYPEQGSSFAKINEEDQFHMETFIKLNQAADRSLINVSSGLKLTSNRNSLSSRASSVYMDQDMTKQEIMKLKFELQSLKLHNEKLLSYIGFELQKQKKNIRKLKSQNGLRVNQNNHSKSRSLSGGISSPSRSSKPTTMSNSDSRKRYEYSDAKLIEQSKEELIYKKRVLRSISINPIMSIINPAKGEDHYGFLTHRDTFGKRIFLNGLHVYLQADEGSEQPTTNEGGSKSAVRKYKSQTFNRVINSDYSGIEISSDSEEVGDEFTTSDESEEEETITLLKQVKWLIFGEHYHKRHRKKVEPKLVDDQLTYKFLSIAIGIIIIGVRFLHPEINKEV